MLSNHNKNKNIYKMTKAKDQNQIEINKKMRLEMYLQHLKGLENEGENMDDLRDSYNKL